MLNELSTKIRPDQKYRTDRKDLDGGALDIHKWIGKIPKPKGGWTPSDYKSVWGPIIRWKSNKSMTQKQGKYYNGMFNRKIKSMK